MFKDVQNLKLAEIEKRIDEIEKNKFNLEEPLRNLEEKLSDMESDFRWGDSRYRGKKTFNKWEQLISRRAEYKKYQAWLAEHKKLPDRIAGIKKALKAAEKDVDYQIRTSGLLEQLEDLESEIRKTTSAQTLFELGIKPEEAVSMLEANGITPVLDESDREVYQHEKDFDDKEDLIMVHKSKGMPMGNRLSTQKELGLKNTSNIELDGKKYSYSYETPRDTLHTSMNGEVSSHLYGDWEDSKYATLQPFAEVDNRKVASAVPNDTYTHGGIPLSRNAWILCPASEVAKAKQQNPNINVLGYQGDNVTGFANPFLSQLGYRAQEVGQWGWELGSKAQDQFYQIAQRENFRTQQHTETTECEDEDLIININKMIALVKLLRDNDLVQSASDFERLKPQLDQQADFGNLTKLRSNTQVREPKNIDDNAIIAHGKQVVVLAEKMQKAGMPLSDKEIQILQTKLNDYRHYTNDTEKKLGVNLRLDEIIERAVVNSMLRSRTIEAERSI